MTDFRLETLTNGFRKIANKKYESLCGHILYDMLREYDVEIRFQQYVKRPNGKFALIDFCFPLGSDVYYGIEVDEAWHKSQQEADKARENHIYQVIENISIRRIDVTDITEKALYNRCREIADEIIAKVKELGDDFHPWEEYSPEAYKAKGYVEVNDYVSKIEDSAKLFDITLKKSGWQAYHKQEIAEDTLVCFFQTDRSDWDNSLTEDGAYFIERKITSEKTYKRWIEKYILGYPTRTKVIFLKERSNPLGIKAYRFVGVFKLDVERTKIENVAVWKKVSDRIDLAKNC